MVPSLYQDNNEPRELVLAKRKLRDTMMAARRSIPHTTTATASESLARHFVDHPILAFCQSIAGYRAMRNELDVMPIFDSLYRYQKHTLLPRIVGKEAPLAFHYWKAGMPLTRHVLGMEEPATDNEQIIPEIILVPLLAFDADGYRLGYGSGLYDRTIAALRNSETVPPLCIGVGYNTQEVERIPTGAYDQPLDGIITECGVSIFNIMHPRMMV